MDTVCHLQSQSSCWAFIHKLPVPNTNICQILPRLLQQRLQQSVVLTQVAIYKVVMSQLSYYAIILKLPVPNTNICQLLAKVVIAKVATIRSIYQSRYKQGYEVTITTLLFSNFQSPTQTFAKYLPRLLKLHLPNISKVVIATFA